ncbi:Photosystem I assembly protein Ycf3 [Prochlorococcus sp. MIT 1303]|nr:Photosystem I assembly protein Ycf3 [Prochlorococcus sp. MIT 1303]
MNLGGIYKDLGNLDQALASTLKSLELKPNNPTAHINLGGIYKKLGNLDKALASTLKSLELKPNNPTTHMNLGGIYYARSDYTNSEKEYDLAIKLSNSISDICYRGKAACLFRKEEYDEAIWLLEKLSRESAFTGKSLWETQAALKATVHAKKQKVIRTQRMSIATSPKEEEEHESLVIIKNRPVTEDLISELYRINSKKLSATTDARHGNGLCTDFQLFNIKLPAIHKLSKDLKAIASEELSKEVSSLKYNSFFNVFNAGAGATPHRHVRAEDKRFNLWQHKYSLVYYLDPGDQNCENPGILRMYNPDIEILPEKGMIVIIPATRVHSSYYEGTKSRLMVGANFYAFTCNQG